MKQKAEIAIIAAPAMGNLVPAVEFATHLINHHPHRISVTILTISIPQRPLIETYVRSRASTQHLRFIQFPPLDPPPPHQYSSTVGFLSLYVQQHKPLVGQALQDLKTAAGSDSVVGLFVDMFSTSMIDVAADLGIPSYLFFASPAAYLGFVLHLPASRAAEFDDSETELTVPSYANPVPSNVFPSFCVKKTDDSYSWFVGHARRYKETKGIIVNTFQDLEPYALDSLSPSNYINLPPVYPVGPVIDHVGPVKWHSTRSDHEKIIEWLDRQPSSSVVFLCFGSMGTLNRAQVRETAKGLERTGFRFLWSLREPATARLALPNDYEDLAGDLFPDGFIDRTAGIGLVCGWAPQVSVLAHRAVGGFVSHCGWNSILESLWYGVPVATWPLYAEQQLNAFEMVREVGLSVEVRVDSRDGSGVVVAAEEVERGLSKLMDGGVSTKVKEMREKSKKALMENGSSFVALDRLVNDILCG